MGVLKENEKEAKSPAQQGFKTINVIVNNFYNLSQFKALKMDKMKLKTKNKSNKINGVAKPPLFFCPLFFALLRRAGIKRIF